MLQKIVECEEGLRLLPVLGKVITFCSGAVNVNVYWCD